MTSNSKGGNENLYKNFLVDINPAKLAPTIESLDRQIESLDSRIAELIQKYTINNAPIMEPLLAYVKDPDEVPIFAKALVRAANLVKAKNALLAKKTTLQSLSEAPHWFMAEFGEFDAEIDQIVEQVSSLTPSDLETPNETPATDGL